MDEEWDDDLEVTLPLFTVQRALNCTTICRLTLGKAHVAHTMAFAQEMGGGAGEGEDFTVTTDSRDPDRIFW